MLADLAVRPVLPKLECDWLAGYKNQTENAYRVIDCLLDELKEYRKIEMAASAVILGLLPMILQSLDNSTVDLALLGIRRPLLALLLSISNPASSMTSSDTWVPLSIDRRLAPSSSPTIKLPSRYSLLCRLLVTAIEYVVAVVAVANIVLMIHELSVHAIIAFAPKTFVLLPVWLGLAFIIHVASTLILALRVRIIHPVI
ncbi:unnamed protein product [Clonostachys rosea f. rosea IK726]|uniref:Uncharacterized protein n=1 Tax=Clonostachys rosea f. rosea IK726 TaxID=1349383 RepID=A0ACA9U5C2_BIOOC|nr:unnamed protein product [Clonostachys rosea f. rosea IK726]